MNVGLAVYRPGANKGGEERFGPFGPARGVLGVY